MENTTNQNAVAENTVSNYEQQTNSNVKTKSVPKLVYIIIGIVLVIIVVNIFGRQSIDNVAIGCAKTVVSEQLKSPSSAIWHDSKIMDKDSYGRYLVYLEVEATNSFGGYITNEYLVVIYNVKKDGHFNYNNFAVQSVTSSTYDIVEGVIKDLNNWNEQIN